MNTWRHLAGALLLYFLATLVFLYPLPFHLGDRIFENGDSYLTIWILSWEQHALTHAPGNFWNGNIFYPEANTLALSELMLPVLPLFMFMKLLSGNPLVAYNATLLATFPLSAVSMWVLIRHLTRRSWAALIAGFVYGFTPIRLSHLHHLQLESMMWLPLLLLAFHRWLDRRRWRDALLTGALFVVQYLTTVYLALYLLPVLFVWFVLDAWMNRRLPKAITVVQATTATALTAAILLPVVLRYRQLSDWTVQPAQDLKIFFSSDLWWNLLAIFPTNTLYGNIFHRFSQSPYERFYFTGFLVPALAAASVMVRRMAIVRFIGAAAIVSFILALGPFLNVSGHPTGVPLPYHWIFDYFPGLEMLRVPARAGLITLTAVTVLCAFGWIALAERFRLSEARFAAVTLVILGAEFFSAPVPLLAEVSGSAIPQAYEYIRNSTDPGGVFEIPTHAQPVASEEFTDRIYTYFSVYHFKSIVAGYSGYFPPSFERFLAATRDLPADQALDLLEAIGVRSIVLHSKYLSASQREAWNTATTSGRRLSKAAEFSDGSQVLLLKPSLKISKDLMMLQWTLTAGAPRNGRVPVSLRASDTPRGGLDYVVNPQIPHVSSIEVLAEWRNSNSEIVAQNAARLSLPYVLNGSVVEFELPSPDFHGTSSLELRILTSPPITLSTELSW